MMDPCPLNGGVKRTPLHVKLDRERTDRTIANSPPRLLTVELPT